MPGNPGNVLGGFPKVSDFGLAALTDATGDLTLAGTILGTPAYMSPEQAAGKTSEIGPPTDVWALGVILYRCLTGKLPFEGDSVLDTLERVKTMQRRPLREAWPEVPADLGAICLACLQKASGDGETLDTVQKGEVRQRASEVELEGQPPLLQLRPVGAGARGDGGE